MDPLTPGGLIDLACANSDQLKWLIGAAAVHFGCKFLTIFTSTPDPTTKLGKLYHAVEVGALVVGKTKHDPTLSTR